jgi:hypothetical protein
MALPCPCLQQASGQKVKDDVNCFFLHLGYLLHGLRPCNREHETHADARLMQRHKHCSEKYVQDYSVNNYFWKIILWIRVPVDQTIFKNFLTD